MDHGIILHKLKDIGITGKLGIWLFQFLTNRTVTTHDGHFQMAIKKIPGTGVFIMVFGNYEHIIWMLVIEQLCKTLKEI